MGNDAPFCAIVVVELRPGKYLVAPATDAWRGGYFGWDYHGCRGHMPKGQFADQNHLLIKGETGTSQEQLKEGISALVNAFEASLAQPGWAPPKLETLAGKLKQYAGASTVSVVRPSEKA